MILKVNTVKNINKHLVARACHKFSYGRFTPISSILDLGHQMVPGGAWKSNLSIWALAIRRPSIQSRKRNFMVMFRPVREKAAL